MTASVPLRKGMEEFSLKPEYNSVRLSQEQVQGRGMKGGVAI
jgi:hypothetical protein